MKITFFSNYLNHHQLPFCQEMLKIADVEFKFVATMPIREERLKLGYKDMNNEDFVIRAYESIERFFEATKLCLESDIIIHGSAPEKFVQLRMERNLPTFRYCERFFKEGASRLLDPRALLNYYKAHTRYRKKPLYLLCASAFTAVDVKRFGAYKNKCYKWGYFPQVSTCDDIGRLVNDKKKGSILWCGRMIDWKHPEIAILLAEKLKKDGYDFNVSIIGTGELEEQLKEQVKQKNLEDHVSFLGSMSPEKVREYMEQSEIFLFTSDKNEGWGAVLNESMNSGCAVVASHAIGSVPFLIKDGENGYIYKSGNIDGVYEKVKFLLDNPEKCRQMGRAAYSTMVEQWNAKNAAERFLKLAEAVCENQSVPDLFDDGVCSKAEVLTDNWFKF